MIFSSLIKKNLTKISINIFKHNLDVKLINILITYNNYI